MHKTLYELIDANKRKTYLFILIISVIFAIVGYTVVNIFRWGISGYLAFAIFIILYNFILYYNSDRLALAVSGAKPADPQVYMVLHNVVEEVALGAGVPKPKVYIIPTSSPNAFATGRNPEHASIAVTEGLLNIMNREELQGVIAHEISHIKNYDILLMTVIAAVIGLLILLRDFIWRFAFLGGRRRGKSQAAAILLIVGLILAVVAPFLALLIRAAISREREYLADASGAYITKYPQGLANALEKLKNFYQPFPRASNATAHLFIASPFGKDRMAKVSDLFATHPPIEKRIERLRALVV
ncbi:zinc metalloprotease HtpX [candidate division WOR-3 bacterium]|uniref:Protease HtpX homolog n=1 Tax=candidate division WOR-3 bacterium TaxID=2052148 RepID=A0A660SFJ8_UNCW3|nr:MAG: zinc metalloprotease HtpX [candidate division WOR-3 bacterium]